MLLLVDFLRRGNGVLKVDRDFLLTFIYIFIFILVRVSAVVAISVILPIVILLGEVNLDIIVVDDTVRALMMAFVFLGGNARVVIPIALLLPKSLLFV